MNDAVSGQLSTPLTTTWLGLTLRSPLVASASPLCRDLDNIRRLEDAGAGAIVLPSLFQEQIEAEAETLRLRVDAFAESSAEARGYFPAATSGPYSIWPDHYLDLVRRARTAVDIPVLASLNGSSRAGWVEYAGLLRQAGASALELNMMYVPADLAESGADVEARFRDIVQAVCASVTIPVSVKLPASLSSPGHFAATLVRDGASGFVLFNRLLEPDIDPLRLMLVDRLALSEPDEMRLPLLWTALLSGRIDASLAASGGVASVNDVVKYLLAGADVVMAASALLRHGAGFMSILVDGLAAWLAARQFVSVGEIRGLLSWRHGTDRGAWTRANYLRILERGPTA
jgi:dihydroorotate dehydrogenase (fumarate)